MASSSHGEGLLERLWLSPLGLDVRREDRWGKEGAADSSESKEKDVEGLIDIAGLHKKNKRTRKMCKRFYLYFPPKIKNSLPYLTAQFHLCRPLPNEEG